MSLLLYHPGVARIACKDCLKYVYDFKTGERETWGPADDRKPQERPPGALPPCFDDPGRPGQPPACPKINPANESNCTLTVKNWRAFEFYRRVRATGGACLTDDMRRDALLMRNLLAIDGIVRAYEQGQLAAAIAAHLPLVRNK